MTNVPATVLTYGELRSQWGKETGCSKWLKPIKIFPRNFDSPGIATNYLLSLNPPSSAAIGALLLRVGLLALLAMVEAVEAS